MIDSDYLLAPIAAARLIDDTRGQAARPPISQRGSDGQTLGSRLIVNLLHVATTAQPFAQQPTVANLIHLRPGEIVGNWRDSTDARRRRLSV